METAYKVIRREALEGIRLRTVGFDIEPELTAKLLLAGRRIVEVPISYNPRRIDEGKKMRWIDGVDAVYTLLKCRFTQ
jgi:dolichol-phosphate mannosyltransferase